MVDVDWLLFSGVEEVDLLPPVPHEHAEGERDPLLGLCGPRQGALICSTESCVWNVVCRGTGRVRRLSPSASASSPDIGAQ